MSRSEERPLVLLFGCADLSRPLRSRRIGTSTVRTLRQIIHPKEDLEARAIVLGPNVVKDMIVTDVVPRLRERWPMVDVVIWAPRATGSLVRDALSSGAKDVVMASSPESCAMDIHEIIQSQQLLPRAARLGDERGEHTVFEGMYARSQRMWDLFDTTTQVAKTDATVLILGETGTGKELLARALHRHSERSGRFVPINCGAVNENLVDSELFGHVKGTFTGATSNKEGLFKHANEGTLFLDEIGNVPLNAQYHLLRALQEGTVRPVGGHEEIPVDVRVVAATSNALEADVQRGRFREDLFYRLDVIRLEVPPLRERPEDIVFLFAHFARKIAKEYNVNRPDLREDFLDALVSYEWPGNVRQLENFTERLVLTWTGRRVGAAGFRRLLPFKSNPSGSARQLPRVIGALPSGESTGVIDSSRTLEETLKPHIAIVERAYLEACLSDSNGRIGEAAECAGISRRTLLRKLNQHGLDKRNFRSSEE